MTDFNIGFSAASLPFIAPLQERELEITKFVNSLFSILVYTFGQNLRNSASTGLLIATINVHYYEGKKVGVSAASLPFIAPLQGRELDIMKFVSSLFSILVYTFGQNLRNSASTGLLIATLNVHYYEGKKLGFLLHLCQIFVILPQLGSSLLHYCGITLLFMVGRPMLGQDSLKYEYCPTLSIFLPYPSHLWQVELLARTCICEAQTENPLTTSQVRYRYPKAAQLLLHYYDRLKSGFFCCIFEFYYTLQGRLLDLMTFDTSFCSIFIHFSIFLGQNLCNLGSTFVLITTLL